MKAEEFDRLFDQGADVGEHIDWASARRPNLETEAMALELPRWIVLGLDRQAQVAGVSRDALVRLWLAERLQGPSRAVAAE